MAITKDQIIEAAELLKAKGINPSMAAVRDKLGGGSFATISPILREWKKSQEQRATVAIKMPSEAKAALERAGVDIWRIVTTLASEKLAKVQDEADEAVKAAALERDESLSEIESLESECKQRNSEIINLTQNNTNLNNEIQAVLKKVAALEKELSITSAKLDDSQQDRNRIIKELEKIRYEAKEAQKIANDREIQIHDEKFRNGRLNAEIEQISERLKVEKMEKTAFEEKAKQLDMQTHKLQISLDVSVSTCDKLKNEVKQLRQTNEEKTLCLGRMEAILEQNEKLEKRMEILISK